MKNLETLRHSTAHLMAAAISKLFPNAKFGIGPAVEDGFYYDIDLELQEEDLKKIEEEMYSLTKKNLKFEKEEISYKQAKELFHNQPYKLELIEGLKDEKITIYKLGDFIDLCKGPHVESSKELKAFKLTKLAGAYWKGDSKNKMLTRVYGTAFETKEELKAYLTLIEEAKKRDHRILGKKLDLFSFHDEGPGFPFWHPKGTIVYEELIKLMREENKKRNYNEIKTPIILNKNLWLTSGHWDKFKENMYFTKIDQEEYAVKPMNCPGGLLIYKTRLHSYRELPIRNAEYGYVHRHELSGVLHGLFRVRAFTQDDAHSFCTRDQLESEIIDMVEYALDIYSKFGFNEYTTFIATKPEKYIGSDEVWDLATNILINSLKKKKIDFKIKEGEGAFYGPKIEFNIKDCLGRNWQCGTIQVDFSMPERFQAQYEGNDGNKHTPVMVHRAILGSIERFLGIVIEHYAGKLPAWLSPVQIAILTVSDKHAEYAKKLKHELDKNFRVELDDRAESIPKKVRDNQQQYIPFIIIIGDKEIETNKLSVRTRDNNIQEYTKEEFIKELEEIIKHRTC